MQSFLNLHGVRTSEDDEFNSLYDCETFLESVGFSRYLMVGEHRIFRLIQQDTTMFARAVIENTKWRPQYGEYPGKRFLVKVGDELYKEHAMEIIEYLKEHEDCIVNVAGGIIEPYVYSSSYTENDIIVNRYQVFSFLKQDFAAEFKLTWG